MVKQVNNIKKYPPGSQVAQDAGCRCPVMDNSYGKGYYGQKDVYVIMADCPLHNKLMKKKERNLP